MKNILFLLFTLISLSSFGQQFLWTTNKNGLFPNSDIKVISKNDVLKKLLEYYETYKFYYDLTGYTKSGFIRKQENSNSFLEIDNIKWSEFKKNISDISELTITCLKDPTRTGSDITILIINKDNVEIIVFTNEMYQGFIYTNNGTRSDDKNRFIKFYKSLVEE